MLQHDNHTLLETWTLFGNISARQRERERERLQEFVRDERRLTSSSWQTGERRSRVAASDENSNSTSPGSANKRRKDSCRSAHGPEARQSSRNHRTVNLVRRPFHHNNHDRSCRLRVFVWCNRSYNRVNRKWPTTGLPSLDSRRKRRER